jgi:DnaJ-class molecular chaperone
MKDLVKCPHCKGNGWDPNGGECGVCSGTGVVCHSDLMPASFSEADKFFAEYYKYKKYMK